jgi:hypothetical protein
VNGYALSLTGGEGRQFSKEPFYLQAIEVVQPDERAIYSASSKEL